MAASVYATLISRVDEYGFERTKGFDKWAYDKFMTGYIEILVRRAKRWEQLIGKKNPQNLKKSAKLERFVKKGIPMKYRSQVWMAISGAKLKKDENPDLYNTLLLKKVKMKDQPVMQQINLDIPRTFPTNMFFKGKDPNSLEQPLFNVLLAFAQVNTEVGYCQGLNYVAGLLLLVTKNEDTSFWLLKTLIEDILPDYYSSGLTGLLLDFKVLEKIIETELPEVNNHMKKFEISLDMILSKWFICLFCDILPIETVFRIWDILMYGNSAVIVRAAYMSILWHKSNILATKDFADLITLLKSFPNSKDFFDCHKFIIEMCHLEETSMSNKFINDIRSDLSDIGSTK